MLFLPFARPCVGRRSTVGQPSVDRLDQPSVGRLGRRFGCGDKSITSCTACALMDYVDLSCRPFVGRSSPSVGLGTDGSISDHKAYVVSANSYNTELEHHDWKTMSRRTLSAYLDCIDANHPMGEPKVVHGTVDSTSTFLGVRRTSYRCFLLVPGERTGGRWWHHWKGLALCGSTRLYLCDMPLVSPRVPRPVYPPSPPRGISTVVHGMSVVTYLFFGRFSCY